MTVDKPHRNPGLGRSALWNVAGQAVPLGAAVLAIPLLLHGLGTERFGILTLAWVVIGYFSLFDLGIGRALTKIVAEEIARGRTSALPQLIRTALLLMGLLGLAATLAMVLVTPWLVHSALNIPHALQDEVLRAFYLLAASVPIVIITSGFRGILEGYNRFDLTNLIRLPMGVFTFLGPLGILPFSHNLVAVIAVLVVGRIVGAGAHAWLCIRVLPGLRHAVPPDWGMIGPLLRLGGWMTVTNIVSPFMVSLDRFLITAILSVAVVAYYTTPYEVVTKLLVLPVAMAGVFFPAFSASYVRDPSATSILFERAAKAVLFCLLPVVLLLTAFAGDLLRIWLGSPFAARSTVVMQWLAIGVLMNGLGTVPFTFLQALGRPDLTGKLQILELPVYWVGVTWLIRHQGIDGAAIAWCARVGIDAIILFAITGIKFKESRSSLYRLAAPVLFGMALLVPTLFLKALVAKTAYVLGALSLLIIVGWFRFLASDERAIVARWVRTIRQGRWKSVLA